MLSWPWRVWNKVWFEPVAPHPLAALRIAFGIYLLAYFLRYLWSVDACFSNEGVYSPFWIADIAPSPRAALIIYVATLLACLSLIVGWHSRLASVAVLILFEYHYLLNFAVTNSSYDRLNTIVIVLLCLSNSGAIWSFDARGKAWQTLIPAWQIRLPQLQLAILYFGAGLCKLLNSNWHTGEMTKFTLAGQWASPLAYQILDLGMPDWFFVVLTWTVVIFELGASVGLYFRPTRPWFIVAGVLFHLFNTIVLMVPEFLNCVAMLGLFIPWHRWQGRSSLGRGESRLSCARVPAFFNMFVRVPRSELLKCDVPSMGTIRPARTIPYKPHETGKGTR